MHQRFLLIGVLLLSPRGAAEANHSPCTPKSTLPGCTQKALSTELTPYTLKKREDHGLKDTMTPQGQRARGFYLTPYYFKAMGAARAARAMKKSHMNAVVVDVKDDLGRILYPSKVPLAEKLRTPLISDPAKAIKIFHENNIYVIARFVTFKDSRLPYVRPDLAVRIGPKSERLFSAGANWIDAYSDEVQDYILDLALELEALGIDEIQFDYIRFPKGHAGTLGHWLHQDKRERSELISGFLEKVDRALRIPISVDVYGLTTLVDGDPRTLGQTIEMMAKYVDAVSPMMYANGMGTYFKDNIVTEQVYNLIHCGLWRARQKAAHIVLRPFLQAYPNSVESFFGPDFIKKQISATERAGADGFLFWNATMRNATAFAALQELGPARLDKLGSNPDGYKEPQNQPGGWCAHAAAIFSGNTAQNHSVNSKDE